MVDRNTQIQATLNAKLIESGEREQMKQLLRQRLMEYEWRDQMKAYCKDIVKQKDLENITVDQLIQEITPKGRALVPDTIKTEMLNRLQQYLVKQKC
ncbi:unnamed protein product [Rotaria magnacalcarata]|uniref:Transcription and mRNA export factor ENY2 n=1 Tax=Rotaria magnacalcarata TaxID=392030 RepID=A0A817AJR6_9BILA|nr:unnamed protein product [Rotaria magnacalcarata]CAF1588560.1 unnamed protein product [Rotaria magnacalcarata]CAF2109840.1 unnamed protein product [Rotaria magnacalcarata]CAF2153091.1 unnamed protein product [Rotaria magnacalcarata]CAF2258154.1 unnamed protein product [Rotaria magnacalcarata]